MSRQQETESETPPSCMRICEKCDIAFVGWRFARYCAQCRKKIDAECAGIESTFKPINGGRRTE